MLPTIRIFVSSPGDVDQERNAADRVIKRLKDRYASDAIIDPVIWEHEPMTANKSFQEQIRPPAECDIVVIMLWARMGTRLPSSFAVDPEGNAYPSGTAYEFWTSFERYQKDGSPDILVYKKTSQYVPESDHADVLEKAAAQKRTLEDFMEKLLSEEGLPKHAYLTFEDVRRFEEILEVHLEKLLERKLFGEVTLNPTWQGNPFLGLHAFDLKHAPIFFGREVAIQRAAEQLKNRATAGISSLLIVGASGGGKSSLVRSGLASHIISSQPDLPHIVLRPGAASPDTPLGYLAQAIEEKIPKVKPFRIRELLEHNPAAVPHILSGIHASSDEEMASPKPQLLLIVDQLEELLTSGINADHQQKFATAIDLLIRSGTCWCLATLRSDYYARLTEIPEFLHFTEESGVFNLQPPTKAEIGQMIRRPARAAGIYFEEDRQTGQSLDDLIRDDAGDHTEILPLLEFTLDELYLHRTENGQLTFKAYNKLGGIEGSVSRRASEVFNKLTTDVQQSLPRVFRQLVTVSIEDAIPTRQRCLDAHFEDDPTARQLVNVFVEARLLSRDEQDGKPYVEIVHEALLKRWQPLVDWLRQEAELLRMRSRLMESFQRWETSGKRSDLLLPQGKALEEGEKVTSQSNLISGNLGTQVAQYVRQSRNAVQRRKRLAMTAVLALALLAVVATGTGIAAISRGSDLKIANADLKKTNINLEQKEKDLRDSNEILQIKEAETQKSAEAAVEAQLESLTTSFEVSKESAENLARTADIELQNDRLTNAIQYLDAAQRLSSRQRSFLLAQSQQRLKAVETQPELAKLFSGPLEDFNQQVLATDSLDPEHWRHRKVNILREFPELVWRRNLYRTIKNTLLSPDRKKLLLSTKTSISPETIIIWDLETNRPTECFVELSQNLHPNHFTWAPDGQSFFTFVNVPDGAKPSNRTHITRHLAQTGKIIAGPIEHSGIVNQAACIQEVKQLIVVNSYDGTSIDRGAFIAELSANSDVVQNSSGAGFFGAFSKLFKGKKYGATVTRYDIDNLKLFDKKTFNGMIESCSIAQASYAVAAYLRPSKDDSNQETRRRIGVIQFDKPEPLWVDEAKAVGDIALSKDGRFLVVPASSRGAKLLEHQKEKLVELATLGFAQNIEQILIKVQRAADDSEEVQIVLAESDDTNLSSPGAAVVGPQIVTSYAYNIPLKQVVTTLAARVNGRIESLDLSINGNNNNFVAVGMQDSAARIWQRTADKSLTPALDLSSNCIYTGFLDEQDYFETPTFRYITVTSDGEVSCWDLKRNALGESIEATDIARARPQNFNPKTNQPMSFALSPDEKTLIHWMNFKRGKQNMVAIKENQLNAELRPLLVDFEPDKILFTDDSRYAVFIGGMVQPVLTGINPLLEVPGIPSAIGAEIPRQSHLAVLDMSSQEFVGHTIQFEGPLVDVKIMPDSHECVLGFLYDNLSKGNIWRVDLAANVHDPLSENLFAFSQFTLADDLETGVIVDRKGQPFLYEKGKTEENLLDIVPSLSAIRFCNQAAISPSGNSVVMSFVDTGTLPIVLNLTSKQFASLSVAEDDRAPQVYSIPGQERFIVSSAKGHIILVDGNTCSAIRSQNLSSRIVNTAFSQSGQMIALCTLDNTIHVYDSHNWGRHVVPVAFPFTIIPMALGQQGFSQFRFSASGNLFAGNTIPLRMRLRNTDNKRGEDSLVKKLYQRPLNFELTSASGMPTEENGNESPEFADYDWFDAYAWSAKYGETNAPLAINLLRRHRQENNENKTFAVRSAFLLNTMGIIGNDITASREGLQYLTSDAIRPEELINNDVRGLVSNRYWFDVDSTLETIERLRDNSHSIFDDWLMAGVMKLYEARCQAAKDKFEEANQLYLKVFNEPSLKFVVIANPSLFVPLYSEAALAGLSAEQPANEALALFNNFSGNEEPEINIGKRYLAYILGDDLKATVDLNRFGIPRDPRIIPFHRFCDEMQTGKTSPAALTLAQQMVELSNTEFRLNTQRPLFPITRAHCRLFEAEAQQVSGNPTEAQAAINAAEDDWKAYESSAEKKGIDLQALWVERVGYQLLKKRIARKMKDS